MINDKNNGNYPFIGQSYLPLSMLPLISTCVCPPADLGISSSLPLTFFNPCHGREAHALFVLFSGRLLKDNLVSEGV